MYIPGCIAAVHVFYGPTAASSSPAAANFARRARALALVALLFNPALLLIDHAHFQYNGISLGLTLAAAAAIGSRRHLLGAALFSAALNHKQMALFFAPGFFAHLLGWALHDESHRSLAAKVRRTNYRRNFDSGGGAEEVMWAVALNVHCECALYYGRQGAAVYC